MRRRSATNRLIAALPRKDREHLLAGCEEVELAFADVICEPGDPIRHVYFPTEIISLLTPRDGCTSLEVGLVGSEGMLGITLMLGVDVSPLRALVQGSGAALRMDAAPFLSEVAHSAAIRRELEALPLRFDGAARANGGMHALPCAGGAARPLAADDPRPGPRERVPPDPRAPRPHARGAQGRRDEGGGRACRTRIIVPACDPLRSRS